MKNYFLLLFIFTIALKFQAQKTLSKEEKKARIEQRTAERYDRLRAWTYGGFEVIQPQNLQHGYQIKNSYWAGPSFDFMGMAHFSAQTGYFTKADSGITTNIKGRRYSFSANIPMPIFKSKQFNVVPHIGIGIFSNNGSDPTIETSGDGGSFGFNLNAGMSLILGPVKLSASYYFDAGYTEKASILGPLKSYPAVSIAFSTQDLLMNPTIFSHRGMKHWKENFQEHKKVTIEKTTEKISDGLYVDKTTTTTTKSYTWDEMSGEKTAANIKDVRPFFFIGPRAQTNFLHINQLALVPLYGINSGFRCGTFYINGIFDMGSIYFKEPFKRNESAGSSDVKELSRTRLDGYFANSTRFGGEVGLDLVTYFIKSGFDDQASFATKTSYYGFIAKVGYFQQNSGTLNFFSDSANVALDNYFKGQGAGKASTDDVRLAPTKINNISVGAILSFGALAFSYDYFYFSKNKALSHSEFSLSYHYPIIRLTKAANVFSKERRFRKQQQKQEKAARLK